MSFETLDLILSMMYSPCAIKLYLAYKNNIAAVTQLVLIFWYRSISTPINNFKNNSLPESKYRLRTTLLLKVDFFGKEVFMKYCNLF